MSSYTRTKVSSRDERTSSTVIGVLLGSIMLGLVFGSILLLDLIGLVQFVVMHLKARFAQQDVVSPL
jgi:hypothetical protein